MKDLEHIKNLEQLPSGAWRYRKKINGKVIRITFDHQPTENEILMSIGDHLGDAPAPKEMLTFENAAKQYVELKRNLLSPSSIREYSKKPGRMSRKFVSLNIYDITALDIQAELNRLAKDKTPKTVFDYHGFISAVIKTFRPDFVWRATLPQKVDKEPYIPTDEEVKEFLAYIKEYRPKYYVCMVLGAFGLRRSEIMAINAGDVDGNTLHITKALVQDENNNWVIKTTKTRRSRRDIEIPADVADMIRENNYAFDRYPSDIQKVINTACKKLKINHFTLHKLRHYFASKLISENVDLMTVMALGGWSSMDMLQKRYAHEIEKKKKDALSHLNDIMS